MESIDDEILRMLRMMHEELIFVKLVGWKTYTLNAASINGAAHRLQNFVSAIVEHHTENQKASPRFKYVKDACVALHGSLQQLAHLHDRFGLSSAGDQINKCEQAMEPMWQEADALLDNVFNVYHDFDVAREAYLDLAILITRCRGRLTIIPAV